MASTMFPRLRRFVAARLSPEEATGLHMTIGVMLMIAAAWLFGGIAEDVVTGDDITLLDVQLAHWLHRHASADVTRIMLFVTHWHGMVGSAVMALLLAGYFHLRKQHYWLLAELFVVPGGMLLNVLLKYVFQRARPSFDDPLLTLSTYSFPSGHTANAALLYGLIGCWLWMRHRGPGARAAIVAAACAMVALVAFSRMYLGVHYLSDVLAASAEGAAWLAVCITGVSTLRRQRALRTARQSTNKGV
jgi:membrane-associated phospholipid phosphatase